MKAARRKPGSTWHLDEMFVTLRGEPYLLWRAVDEHGAELDILVQKRRDKTAAKRFFKRVLRSSPVPRKIVTDQLRSYPAAKAEFRAQAASAARFTLSQTTRGAIRCVVRNHRSHPKSVLRFLRDRRVSRYLSPQSCSQRLFKCGVRGDRDD